MALLQRCHNFQRHLCLVHMLVSYGSGKLMILQNWLWKISTSMAGRSFFFNIFPLSIFELLGCATLRHGQKCPMSICELENKQFCLYILENFFNSWYKRKTFRAIRVPKLESWNVTLVCWYSSWGVSVSTNTRMWPRNEEVNRVGLLKFLPTRIWDANCEPSWRVKCAEQVIRNDSSGQNQIRKDDHEEPYFTST